MEIDKIIHPCGAFSVVDSRIDWERDGLGIEVKHAQMLFHKRDNYWICTFSCIKCALKGSRERDVFDELWLVVYSPFALHFFKHPGGTVGYVECGLRMKTGGHNMPFTGPSGVLDPKEALDAIMQKMEAKGCQLFAEVVWEK